MARPAKGKVHSRLAVDYKYIFELEMELAFKSQALFHRKKLAFLV
jgi:hypothetical protein